MPRDPAGNYTYPSGTRGSAGTPIESLKYNNYIDDIALALNTPLPITAGGTGGATSSDAMNNLGGELAKQVVTNYSTFPFQSGSFYSTAGATDAPTVNAFIGICYTIATSGIPPTATDMFIEARDQVTGQLWVRQKKANVWQPWVSGTSVVSGSTAPTSPSLNTVWWDNTRGKPFIWYDDGVGTPSAQWVEMVAVPDIDPNAFVEITGDTMIGPLVLNANPTLPLGAVPKQYVDTAILTSMRGYLSGLTLSSGGGAQTFNVAAGTAMDFASTGMMTTPSISKSANNWTVGNNGGSLDSGGPVTPSTWYHVFIIRRPDTGVVDICTSISTTPNIGINIPVAYTQYRRIGAMKTDGSSNWVAFTQLGDEFLWVTSVTDVNTSTLGTTATLFTLTVPAGLQVLARLRGHISNATVNISVLVNSPDEAVATATPPNATVRNPLASGAMPFGELQVRTNTSAQVRAVASAASTSLGIATYGWIDRRGRDA